MRKNASRKPRIACAEAQRALRAPLRAGVAHRGPRAACRHRLGRDLGRQPARAEGSGPHFPQQIWGRTAGLGLGTLEFPWISVNFLGLLGGFHRFSLAPSGQEPLGQVKMLVQTNMEPPAWPKGARAPTEAESEAEHDASGWP